MSEQSTQRYEFCWQAAEAGDLEQFQRLHEAALNLKTIDTTNFSMLDFMILAAQYHHIDCFHNSTAYAAKNGHFYCLQYASEHGCEINFHTMTSVVHCADSEQLVPCFEYCYEKMKLMDCIWDDWFNPVIPRLDFMKYMYRFLFTQDLQKCPELKQAIEQAKKFLQQQQFVSRIIATNHGVCNDVVENCIVPLF